MTEHFHFETTNEAIQMLADEISVMKRAITILAHALDIAGAIDINGFADALDLPEADERFRERIALFANSLRVEPAGWSPTVIDGGKGD